MDGEHYTLISNSPSTISGEHLGDLVVISLIFINYGEHSTSISNSPRVQYLVNIWWLFLLFLSIRVEGRYKVVYGTGMFVGSKGSYL